MFFQMTIMRLRLPVSTVGGLSRCGCEGKHYSRSEINDQTATTSTAGTRVTEGRQPSSTKETRLEDSRTMMNDEGWTQDLIRSVSDQVDRDIQTVRSLGEDRNIIELFIDLHDLAIRRSRFMKDIESMDKYLNHLWKNYVVRNRKVQWAKTDIGDSVDWCEKQFPDNDDTKRRKTTQMFRSLTYLVKSCGSIDGLKQNQEILAQQFKTKWQFEEAKRKHINVTRREIDKGPARSNNDGGNDDETKHGTIKKSNTRNAPQRNPNEPGFPEECINESEGEMENGESEDGFGDLLTTASDDETGNLREHFDLFVSEQIIGDHSGEMLTQEEMNKVYHLKGGPLQILRDRCRLGEQKLDVQAGIFSPTENDGIIRSPVEVETYEVMSEDGKTTNTYFSINGDDWLSKRFQMEVARNHEEQNVCFSTEIKRSPNQRTIRISTSHEKAIFSYNGNSSRISFVEADAISNFERSVIKVIERIWVDERNRAFREYIETFNARIEEEYKDLPAENRRRYKKWCRKFIISVIQACEGELSTMTFGLHSDEGPDLMWKTLIRQAAMKISKYLPHLSTMEVMTLSTTRRISGHEDEPIMESGGKCVLEIYNDDGKGPKAKIPLGKIAMHGQLAGAQLNCTHWPKAVNKDDTSWVRNLYSCRDGINLNCEEAAMAWLSTLNAVQRKALERTMIAHTHKKDEPTTGLLNTPPFYKDLIVKFEGLRVEGTRSARPKNFIWPAYKYGDEEKKPIDPATYAKVDGNIMALTTNHEAHTAAVLNGKMIVHKYGEENLVCLCNRISKVGDVLDKDAMAGVLKKHCIRGRQDKNPLCAEKMENLTGLRATKWYKNDVCAIGRALRDIKQQRNGGGLEWEKIKALLDAACAEQETRF